MNFLVMGCGSIGERHVINLKAIIPDASINVFDPQSERLMALSKKYSVDPVNDEIVNSTTYDCVFICTPPVSHIEIARRALNSGSNIFIEKPLSHSLDGIEELQNLVRSKQLLAFVAYNFRFNKGIHLVKQMIKDLKFGKILHASAYFGQFLPDWRPWQDYKKSYSARRDLGGGIIHDGSHEIDYLIWLFGRPIYVQSQFALTDILSSDTEAIADILLKFDKNILGYIHLDFVRREYKRTLELLCENGLIQWSLSDATIRTFSASSKTLDSVQLEESLNDMYLEEIRHVIKCIKTKNNSEIIDLENGVSTLRLCHNVYESGISGQRLSL
jgi:predicted dehydrogenase